MKQIKVRISDIFFLVVFFALVVMVGGCTDTFDYSNYRDLYNGRMSFVNIEGGFESLMKLCSASGLPYNIFRLGLISGCYSAIFFRMRAIIGNSVLAIMVLYFFSAAAFDAVNLRNTIVLALFLFSFLTIVFSETSGAKAKALVTVSFGVFFHKIALFYVFLILLLVFPKLRKIDKASDFLFMFGISVFFLLSIDKSVLQAIGDFIFSIISSLGVLDTKKLYFNVQGNYGYLMYSFCSLLYIAIVWLLRKLYLMQNYRSYSVGKLLSCVNFYNLIVVFLLPTIRMNSELYRLFRNMQLVEYFCFFYCMRFIPLRAADRILFYGMIVFACVINFICIILPFSHQIFLPMFTSNFIF